jgi:hypothetical protein
LTVKYAVDKHCGFAGPAAGSRQQGVKAHHNYEVSGCLPVLRQALGNLVPVVVAVDGLTQEVEVHDKQAVGVDYFDNC